MLLLCDWIDQCGHKALSKILLFLKGVCVYVHRCADVLALIIKLA